MSEFRTYAVAESAPTIIKRDFGVKDRFGRAIGALVSLRECDMAEKTPEMMRSSYSTKAPGHYFTMGAMATRAGEGYGATQERRFFKTEAERDAAVEKYFREAAKRAAKREGK